jgi:hypothetical protein
MPWIDFMAAYDFVGDVGIVLNQSHGGLDLASIQPGHLQI